MKVRFKLAWQFYTVGQTIEPPAMLRNWLLSRGYVEPVIEEVPIAVQAATTEEKDHGSGSRQVAQHHSARRAREQRKRVDDHD